jgi:hypothetical protein
MGKGRLVILAAVCALSFGLPALACLAVLLAPVRSMVELWLVAAAAAAVVAALGLVGWWEFAGLWLRWGWGALVVGSAAWRMLEARLPPVGAPGLAGAAAAVALGASASVLVQALRARSHPGQALALELPLRGGRFLVTDGGDGARSFLVNYHYGFAGHRGAGVSASMRYALDLVEVGRRGAAGRGLLPRRNEDCRIWERPLHAPCDGRVVKVVDEVEDNGAFGAHRPYGVGNQVVIRTAGDVYVVLGHLRRGSVLVREGAEVRRGTPLGRVGNSGWTERPHLHLQAMRSPEGDWWHGEPVPVRFGGRFPVKNQVVRSPA